jgi:hypothetical protein
MNVDGDKGIMEIPRDLGNGGFCNPGSGQCSNEEMPVPRTPRAFETRSQAPWLGTELASGEQ